MGKISTLSIWQAHATVATRRITMLIIDLARPVPGEKIVTQSLSENLNYLYQMIMVVKVDYS